jgi:hypothetical protein
MPVPTGSSTKRDARCTAATAENEATWLSRKAWKRPDASFRPETGCLLRTLRPRLMESRHILLWVVLSIDVVIWPSNRRWCVEVGRTSSGLSRAPNRFGSVCGERDIVVNRSALEILWSLLMAPHRSEFSTRDDGYAWISSADADGAPW